MAGGLRALIHASVLLCAGCATSHTPRQVSFSTPDGGWIDAHEYGSGDHGVVLAHGGRFHKESWAPQAEVLAAEGFRVLAIDFRDSEEGMPLDVLGAVRHLRRSGAATVSVIGGSIGGWAASVASVQAEPGEINRLVLLASGSSDHPELIKGRKLFVMTRDDPHADGSPRLPGFREEYDRAPGPKELLVLDGNAHAQYIFATEQGERLMEEIVRFLSEPARAGPSPDRSGDVSVRYDESLGISRTLGRPPPAPLDCE